MESAINAKAKAKLRKAAKVAKELLSADNDKGGQMTTDITVDSLLPDVEDYEFELTKATFEDICATVFAKIRPLVERTLRKASVTEDDIDTVVFVGGSTRIPKVKEILIAMFGENKINRQVNPDQAVAAGAGILAGLKSGARGIEEFKFKDVTTHNIGIALYNSYADKDEFKVLIPKNSEMPHASEVQCYSTTIDDQKEVRI